MVYGVWCMVYVGVVVFFFTLVIASYFGLLIMTTVLFIVAAIDMKFLVANLFFSSALHCYHFVCETW